jgi:hypothetical protein
MSDFTMTGLPSSLIAGTPPPNTAVATPMPQPQPVGEDGYTSARDTLSKLLQDGLKRGAYDSTADFEKYLKLLDTASTGKSKDEFDAEQMLEQAKGLRAQADYMAANPLAPPSLESAPNYPQLQLPGVPTDVQPHPNGVASLGAGLAGLFAPRASGRFGASALQGAIAATVKANEARQQKYKFDLQQSLLKQQEAVREEDARKAVEAQNNKLTNAYSAATHSENLQSGLDRLKAAQIEGTAGDLKKWVEGNKPAELAKAQAAALSEQIDQKQKEADKALDRANRAAALQEQLEKEHRLTLDAQQKAADREAEERRKVREDAAKEQDRRLDRQVKVEGMSETRREHDLMERDRSANRSLRATEIGLSHMDRMATQKETHNYHEAEIEVRYQANQNSGKMFHHTPEMDAALMDANVWKQRYEAASKLADASPSDPEKRKLADRIQAGYNRARTTYMKISNKAQSDAEQKSRKVRSSASTRTDFRYDASGNRIP